MAEGRADWGGRFGRRSDPWSTIPSGDGSAPGGPSDTTPEGSWEVRGRPSDGGASDRPIAQPFAWWQGDTVPRGVKPFAAPSDATGDGAGRGEPTPTPPPVPFRASAEPLPGRIAHFEPVRMLGQGGMGTIYEAVHVRLHRRVALKLLAADRRGERESRARFRREVRAVGSLDHPNIIRVHDGDPDAEVPYLVMELVDGVDLGHLGQRLGGLRVADACELVRQALVGLQHAFENGLIHRDLKPSNLMLAADGRVRVLDWGLARFLSEEADGEPLTRSGYILGTIDYLAPERVARPDHLDIRSDLYSLGCTLFQLLCGHPPHARRPGGDRVARMLAHACSEVPRLRELRPDAPAALERVLARMLAREPDDRFATPRQAGEALAPLCAGHDLAALLSSYRAAVDRGASLFDQSTGQPVIDRGEDGRTGARRPRPRWAIPALYLVAGAVILGGLWASRRPDSSPPDPAPDSGAPMTAKDTPVDPAGADATVQPPPVPQVEVKPAGLTFDRARRSYLAGEPIRVTVAPGANRFVAIDQVVLDEADGAPVRGPVTADLTPGVEAELVAGRAEGIGVIVVLSAPERIDPAELSRLGSDLRALAADGPDEFLRGVERLAWPPGTARQIERYDTDPGDGEMAPRQVALCVGASSYRDNDIDDLRFAEGDAEVMAGNLEKLGGYEVLARLTGDSVTREQVEDWLFRRLPAATRPGDRVVIYWSGHGGKVRDGDLDESDGDGKDECLLLHETSIDEAGEPDRDAVLVDDRLAEALGGLKGRQVALILDVCFAGGAVKGAGGRAPSVGGLIDASSVEGGAKGPATEGPVFLAAGTDDQKAFGHTRVNLSVMTYFLDEALNAGEGLSLADAYEYVKHRVPGFVSGLGRETQTPVLGGPSEVSRSFLLRQP